MTVRFKELRDPKAKKGWAKRVDSNLVGQDWNGGDPAQNEVKQRKKKTSRERGPLWQMCQGEQTLSETVG